MENRKIDYTLDMEQYARLARQTAAESCVLLKNENKVLPLEKGEKVAVFGRCAFRYYKSGLGSGGLVNTKYVVGILDAIQNTQQFILNEKLIALYEKWMEENPYDEGHGWGTVPWSQQEMPVTKEMIDVAKESHVAMVIIGRTAGEDQDNKNEEGSYLLTQTERNMIKEVCSAFEKTIVLLNVGNIIDMRWVEEYNPSAVMYVWQGGQEGGNGVLDVLTGAVSPCGKLTDTIATNIKEYPSTPYFGDPKKNYYKEDIYVGYRYFETCAKDKVLYPFGFGMSYTSFDKSGVITYSSEQEITVNVSVKNTGQLPGKEVVQIYVSAPQGKLGKPSRALVAFEKTKCLAPGEVQQLEIHIPISYLASYDDSGITGHKSCFVLEEGEYALYMGADVRSATLIGSVTKSEQVIEQLQEVCAPIESFERFKVTEKENSYVMGMETVPTRTEEILQKIARLRDKEILFTGNQGYQLADVLNKKISLDNFTAQLSDDDLIHLFRGEGMCSPKVTPGTAGAFGGLTEELKNYGIPALCCADGPSGIRMDCGAPAFSLPNGTALGCTFNMKLVEELYQCVGIEMRYNQVDLLLGPGMNIHRNPLNGRNFEYISEDPILTGKMSVAQLHGLHHVGVMGTIKHFCANNQEAQRCVTEAVVSERALREIYLKGFEMAVKEGNAKAVMTTYGPVNGIWTAGSYDLCTVVLRKEWNYKGIVMTDWWAVANDEGEDAEKENRAPMVVAQNDVYMCCADAQTEQDNVDEKLKEGIIKRSDLQRNAKNILELAMVVPAMERLVGKESKVECINDQYAEETQGAIGEIANYETDPETHSLTLERDALVFAQDKVLMFGLTVQDEREYFISAEIKSELGELAQLSIGVYMDNIYRDTISLRGTEGKCVNITKSLGYIKGKHHYIKLVLGSLGIEITKLKIHS
jgi:beta-glucosidase